MNTVRRLVAGALVLGLALLLSPVMASDPTVAAGSHPVARTASGGWQRVATESFTSLDAKRWSKFQGRPGCCTDTVWDPSRVSVSGGVLTLANHPDADGTWRSGGVGAWDWKAANRRYGRWDARIRFDAGTGVSGTALLWPGAGWPPEINYFEIYETWGTRNRLMTTTHFGTPAHHKVDQRITRADFTSWHVFSVRWTPKSLTFVVDGRVVHTVRDPAAIPRQAMWPGFQTHVHQLGDGRMPTLPRGSRSVRMQVDWLRVYAPVSTLG